MNDPLFGNKLAAAILVALLLFFGLPQLADRLLGGGHHGGGGEELHLAYPIEYKTGLPSTGGNEDKVIPLGNLMASAVAEVGERRFQLCKSCHTYEKGGANGTGPNLWNIVGRPVASVDGFGYSGALKDFGGVWTYERLDGYLKNSQSYVPGTAMVQRLPKDSQRAELLAYLGALSDSPVAFPEPVELEEETPEGE